MLSFCQNKIITTGEGGAIVTDSREMYERLKLLRSHGRLETQDYFSSSEIMDYITLGYNFRMSNITAALGIAQLRKADEIIEMRRKNVEYLAAQLKDVEDVTTPKTPKDYYNVYQMFTIRISATIRDDLIKYLADKGVMTKVYFPPIHLTDFYKNKLRCINNLPVTEELSSKVLTLPMHPTLTDEEMDYMSDEIKNFFGVV